MKKLTAAILAMSLLASLSLTANAATKNDDVTLTPLKGIDCCKGCVFSVAVSTELDNLCGVHLRFGYDQSKLKFAGADTSIGHGEANDKNGILEWSTMLNAKGQPLEYQDTIAVINFELLDDVSELDDYISFGVVEAFDSGLKDVDFFNNSCFMLDSAGSLPDIGDVTRDSVIDADDALFILRSSAQLEPLTWVTKTAADVNSDKAVDSNDAILVLRHSVGIKSKDSDLGTTTSYNSSRTIYP